MANSDFVKFLTTAAVSSTFELPEDDAESIKELEKERKRLTGIVSKIKGSLSSEN